MIQPVRIALVRVGQSINIIECYPYDFRKMVDGFFGHRHLDNGLVLGYREPRLDVAADLEQPATWYPSVPNAPFFFCRQGPSGGFESLTASDIATLMARGYTSLVRLAKP